MRLASSATERLLFGGVCECRGRLSSALRFSLTARFFLRRPAAGETRLCELLDPFSSPSIAFLPLLLPPPPGLR
jgi:hypothetical protein